MDTPSRFIFDSFEIDKTTRTILLRYSFDDELNFTEALPLPADVPLDLADSPDVQRALFALHLAGGVSYYKAFCPKNSMVRSGDLNAEQATFWNTFYTHGLGEFFYQNKLDFRGLINFPVTKNTAVTLQKTTVEQTKTLLPFGGGKDSIVTMQLLQQRGIRPTIFRLRAHKYIDELADLTSLPRITVERQLDPQLFTLNSQGAYNGHVPITGYITFLSIVIALLSGHDSVAFSNERSADYGNVDYLGMTVNHQWSKGIEAEKLVTNYIQNFVTNKVQYLNPLRPLSELKIAEIFANYPNFFAHTTSCNQNWLMLSKDPHQGAWCGHCYKCCFIFALYAAVLPGTTVITMYGKNLFDDETLLHTYRQLWGAEGIKPFDCVGTPDEMRAAMHLALKKPEFAQTPIGRDFATHIVLKNPDTLVQDILKPDFTNVPPASRKLLEGIL
ncbi:MAG TPA: hypothetical protein VLG40_01685 [Candidatus Saccharimonas sp.]|nr:hypothetical protein [Candidatus Saccharimonas sp.]